MKDNPEAVSKASKKWRTKNPDRHKQSFVNWSMTEQGKTLRRESGAFRRARKSNATPKWLTENDRTALKQFYENCPDGYEVDHIIPLKGETICGLHVLSNLQYLPKFENRSKHNKWSSPDWEL